MLGLSQIFGKEVIVGLDIGSRFTKIVQAEPGPGNGYDWRILKVVVGPTPPDSVRDGIIVDPSTVSKSIKDLMHSADITATGAATAISGSSVIVRHVKLPKMKEELLRKGIRYEAKQYISSNTEDSMIEFEITGPVPGENDKMGVMLVAVPNDMVESRLSTIVGAGLEPVAIDLEAFSLQRALFDLNKSNPGMGTTIALLNIGALTTDVNIITEGQFALTRNIGIAGDSFTNALKPIARKTDWDDLETIKFQVDMGSLLDTEASPESIALAQAVQPTIDELLREVRRSINYYQSQLSDSNNSNLPAGISSSSGGGTVSKIVISGGGARFLGLDKYMAARLGIDVEVWNIFDNPCLDSSALSDSYKEQCHTVLGISLGLSLKEYVEDPSIQYAARKHKKAKAA